MSDLRVSRASDLRVHLSFDLDHDRDLEGRLLAQSRAGSDFAVASRSEAGEMGAAWIARVRRQISSCDEVVVICGDGGCIERVVNDYGPSKAGGRVIDMYRPDFFRICGCGWWSGTTQVTIRVY